MLTELRITLQQSGKKENDDDDVEHHDDDDEEEEEEDFAEHDVARIRRSNLNGEPSRHQVQSRSTRVMVVNLTGSTVVTLNGLGWKGQNLSLSQRCLFTLNWAT